MNPGQRQRLWSRGVFFAGLSLLLYGFPSPVEAGWYIASTTIPPNSSASAWRTPQVVTRVAQNRLTYETRAWTQVIDLNIQQLSIISHLGQVYWRGPIEAYATVMAARAQERRAQAERLMNQLPHGSQQFVARRAGPFDSLSPRLTITITPMSEAESVAGYAAHKYRIQRNGIAYEETWLAEKIKLSTDVDMSRLNAFIGKLQTSRTTPPGAVLAELTELINIGYPVRTVNLVTQVVKEVVQAEQRPIRAEVFMVPDGYTKKALVEIMFPTGRRL